MDIYGVNIGQDLSPNLLPNLEDFGQNQRSGNRVFQTQGFQMKERIIVGLGIVLMVAGCSHRAIYESAQLNNIRRCQELPIPQQSACEAQYQTSFDEYSRDREELLEESED